MPLRHHPIIITLRLCVFGGQSRLTNWGWPWDVLSTPIEFVESTPIEFVESTGWVCNFRCGFM